jgi:hypothetical protein
MAKQQKELDGKEREERTDEGDGDTESCHDESDEAEADDEADPNETPAKSQKVVFDMKDAKAEPIVWKSPNGTTQTAVRIPCAGTRISFRKSAKQTGWIEHVVESMYNK